MGQERIFSHLNQTGKDSGQAAIHGHWTWLKLLYLEQVGPYAGGRGRDYELNDGGSVECSTV